MTFFNLYRNCFYIELKTVGSFFYLIIYLERIRSFYISLLYGGFNLSCYKPMAQVVMSLTLIQMVVGSNPPSKLKLLIILSLFWSLTPGLFINIIIDGMHLDCYNIVYFTIQVDICGYYHLRKKLQAAQ